MMTPRNTSPPIGELVKRVRSRLTRYATAATAFERQRRTLHALSALDDRTLRDIGLNRSMLLGASIHGVRPSKDAF